MGTVYLSWAWKRQSLLSIGRLFHWIANIILIAQVEAGFAVVLPGGGVRHSREGDMSPWLIINVGSHCFEFSSGRICFDHVGSQ